MLTAKKPMNTSKRFSAVEIAAAKAAAAKVPPAKTAALDWSQATVTPGGGVASTITALRRTRGPNKKAAKEQIAIRLDLELVTALRASGPGWQTRVNTALKDWLATQPGKPKSKRQIQT